jgi:rhodanese-related sulfurtransferase
MFFERLPEFIANHVMLVGIALALLVALIGHEIGRLTRGYKALSPHQLVGMINRDNALVVDVSANTEFQNGHVVGAKHVAMSQFDPENKDLAKVRDLPVVVYCRTGQTSAEACARLKKAGFSKVFWLDGGLNAWLAAELPVTKGAK